MRIDHIALAVIRLDPTGPSSLMVIGVAFQLKCLVICNQ